jgi:hypothetical protein
MEISGQLHSPAVLTPGTLWIRGWVDYRAGLDVVANLGLVIILFFLSSSEMSHACSCVSFPVCSLH